MRVTHTTLSSLLALAAGLQLSLAAAPPVHRRAGGRGSVSKNYHHTPISARKAPNPERQAWAQAKRDRKAARNLVLAERGAFGEQFFVKGV